MVVWISAEAKKVVKKHIQLLHQTTPWNKMEEMIRRKKIPWPNIFKEYSPNASLTGEEKVRLSIRSHLILHLQKVITAGCARSYVLLFHYRQFEHLD